MTTFDSGVSGYVRASCTVEVLFPVDMKGRPDICCKYCKLYLTRGGVSSCAATGEIVPWPEHYVGGNCPLKEVQSDE